MYVVIHIPEGIDHVMSFHITQARGVEESSHFVKIRLFGGGCRGGRGGTKMEEREDGSLYESTLYPNRRRPL